MLTNAERNIYTLREIQDDILARLLLQGVVIEGADSARGTMERADIVTQTVDNIPLTQLWNEFGATLALWNRQRDPLMSLLTYNVTDLVEQVMWPTQDDFEVASEYGVPKGIRQTTPFAMGYDFEWYDLAIRFTWKFLIDAKADQVRQLVNQVFESDNRLMFNKILKRLFNNTSNAATLPTGTAITAYPLYNGDSMVPPQYKATTFSTHNHYLASGATTVDPGDLDVIEAHLFEHGYRINNGYQLVILANRQETQVIKTFKLGTNGALYDFMPTGLIGGGIYLPNNGGIVARPSGSVAGMSVIGTYGPFLIVEEDYIPAGYMVAYASGGEENIGNLVGIREHESVKGLKQVKGPNPDYPLVDSYYRRGFGTGVRHRGAGVVMKITAGSYTVPAAYA